MANPELLAMLTAHGVTPGHVPGGGVPELTALDVAAMMAGCNDLETALLRAKYCLDSQSRAWSLWLYELLIVQGWASGNGTTARLATYTLNEYLAPERCRVCRGLKQVVIDKKVITCDACGATGNEPRSERRTARALRLGNQLREPWRDRLTWCRIRLQNIEAEALSKVR